MSETDSSVRRQPAVLLPAAAALIALVALPFLSHAPNRLLSGRPLSLLGAAAPIEAWALISLSAVIAIAALARARPAISIAITLAAGCGIVLLVAAAGDGARQLAQSAPPASRTSLAAGFWVAMLAYGFSMRAALANGAVPRWFAVAVPLATAAGIAALFAAGMLDALSVMKEYLARRDEFLAALLRHGSIALLGVVPAVLIGAALGLLAHRNAQARGPIFVVLDTVQTIPSVAIFALLMTPFAALAGSFPTLREMGFGGIGVAPAVVAIVLYLLLPLARSVEAGLRGVEPAVVDAARGMGLSPRRILLRVEAPLAMPTMLAGLRIAVVQAIGLATLAALIGGGGLGTFIFQGMGQFALDLVLLGVLPIAALTAFADAALRALEAQLGGDRR